MIRPVPDGSSVDLDMTPIIDIVFNLLIFLLLSYHISSASRPLDLPSVLSAAPPPSAAREATVQVRSDGSLLWEGRAVDLASLELLLRPAGGPVPAAVVLEADRGAEWGRVQEVLWRISRAGVGTVRQKVLRRAGEGR